MLITSKIDAEYSRAESLAKLSNFPLNHLKNSPFASVAEGIVRRADNEAFQAFCLVESIKNDIYEPLYEDFRNH